MNDAPNWKVALWAVALSVVLLPVMGCDDSASGGGCVRNQDCPLPEVCVDGACALECRIDDDCTRGSRCIESRCQSDPIGRDASTPVGGQGGAGGMSGAGGAGGGVGMACRRNAECPLPLLCIDNECALECRIDRDCEDGERCVDNLCTGGEGGQGGAGGVPQGGMGGDGGMGGVPQGGDGGAGGMGGVPQGGMGGEPMGGMMMGDGQYGDRCDGAAQCESGFCVENKRTGQRQCTIGCANANSCPGTDLCLGAQSPEGGIVNVCFPNDTGLPCGGPGDVCVSGFCLQVPGSTELSWFTPPPVCSAPCENDFKCPQGYRCLPVNTDNGMQNLCAPNVDVRVCPQGNNAACAGVCPGGGNGGCVAYVQQPGGNGFCSCTCQTSAQCPRGFACNDFNDGNGGACVPLAGYKCNVGGQQGADQCLTGACLYNDERPNLSACTAFCANAQGCPEDYSCNAIPDGNGGMANVCVLNE
ncbi:MAG: hypothetical protein ACE366_22570 [Bradymonadia bacterium]